MSQLAPPLLSVVDLAKSYGSKQALAGMTFEVFSGEFLALLGPNGAGKTSLIRSICGRVRPDSGEIRFSGQPLKWRRDRREIGLVPQDLAVYLDLTARENMVAFAKLHGVPRREVPDVVDEALEWTGLADRQHHLVGSFSGGMKRRVNIACGVLHKPKLVLLDEPTVGVDPQSREKIFEMLLQMRNDGTAFLITTHHLDEAESRCDRIVIVDHGRVIASGSLSELITTTVGSASHVQLRLAEIPDASVSQRLSRVDIHVNGDGRTINGPLGDVARDLPVLLAALAKSGCRVHDVQVRPPSLQNVFLHLTGRKLRD